MKILYLLIVLIICSCAPKIIPLKGSYSDGNFEGYSDKTKDQVWENIVDFFAKSGLPIKIIDRTSGLIISDETELVYTTENSKGQLKNKNAWVVVQRMVDPGSKKDVTYYNTTAEWNIRIKENSGRTLINVNLVNPTYTRFLDTKIRTSFKKGAFQSTGVFEKTIYDIVK